MENRNAGIKGSQFTFLVAGFVYGSFLLQAFLTKPAQHDVWIVLLSGSLMSIPLILCFSALGKLFPDNDLVAILEIPFGLWLLVKGVKGQRPAKNPNRQTAIS
jgi:hypothetical protein